MINSVLIDFKHKLFLLLLMDVTGELNQEKQPITQAESKTSLFHHFPSQPLLGHLLLPPRAVAPIMAVLPSRCRLYRILTVACLSLCPKVSFLFYSIYPGVKTNLMIGLLTICERNKLGS